MKTETLRMVDSLDDRQLRLVYQFIRAITKKKPPQSCNSETASGQ